MVDVIMPYVVLRGRSHRYRRRPPSDVRDKFPNQWLRTWRPGTPIAQVQAEARRLAAKHDNLIAAARGQEVTPEQIEEAETFARELIAGDRSDLYGYLEMAAQYDMTPQTLAIINAIQGGGRYIPETMPITAALARDVERYGKDRDPRPFTQALTSFVALIGDKDAMAITRADVLEWIRSMDHLKPVTVRRRVGCLGAVLNRLFRDQEIDRRNPFAGHVIKDSRGRSSDRLPFSTAHLAKIDAYLTNSQRTTHETKAITRLLKGTGCGPGEIGGLVLADVSLDSEVPFIHVRPNHLRGVKVPARTRRVPLVGEALAAAQDAFERAVARADGKSPDHAGLFATFGVGVKAADAISAKLSKMIRAAGVPKSRRLTSYSYRHAMKEALRSAGVADHVQRRIMGHSGTGVADRYGSPELRLEEARDALTAALEHLGRVDPSIFSERERLL